MARADTDAEARDRRLRDLDARNGTLKGLLDVAQTEIRAWEGRHEAALQELDGLRSKYQKLEELNSQLVRNRQQAFNELSRIRVELSRSGERIAYLEGLSYARFVPSKP